MQTTSALEGDLMFVQEFCGGGTLRERIKKRNYSVLEAIRWLLAVRHAHSTSYTHASARASTTAHYLLLTPAPLLLHHTDCNRTACATPLPV